MTSNTSKVLTLSSAQLVMTIVTVVSGMVFTRYLSVADYATYMQTFLAYDFATPLLTLGLPSALYYFLPGCGSDEKGIVIDTLTLLFLLGSVFTCFLILGGTDILANRFDNPQLKQTLKWLYFYPLYTFPIVLNAVLVVKDKVKVNAYYNVITGLILTLSIITASILTGSCNLPILVKILLPLMFFPVASYLSFKYTDGLWRLPSRSSMGTIIKFAVPLGLATILGSLTLQIANIIVSLLCSPEDFAIYVTGAKEVPIVGIVTGSMSVIIMSEMAKKCKIGDKKAALELFRKSALIGGGFLFPIMVILFVYANEFIDILYTSKYADSIYPFRVYLLYLPIRIVLYGAAFIALGKSKAILYRSIIELLLTTLLCYIFVYFWGYKGAVWAQIFTLYFWSIPYNLYFLKNAFDCSSMYILPIHKLGKILLISIVSGILSGVFLLFDMPSLFKLLLGCIGGGVCYLVGIYFFETELKEFFKERIRSIFMNN